MTYKFTANLQPITARRSLRYPSPPPLRPPPSHPSKERSNSHPLRQLRMQSAAVFSTKPPLPPPSYPPKKKGTSSRPNDVLVPPYNTVSLHDNDFGI